MECPVGHMTSSATSPLKFLRLYRDAAKVLRSIGEAGVVYRDFNLGNILQLSNVSFASSEQLSCLIIDFGNSRFAREPRDAQEARTLDTADFIAYGRELATRSREEAISGNVYFRSLNAARLGDDSERVVNTLERLEKGHKSLAECTDATEKEMRGRWFDETREYIQKRCEKLEGLQLGTLDDLQSLWLCFMYAVSIL